MSGAAPSDALGGATEPPARLCAIAREAIAAALRGSTFMPTALPGAWQRSRGVFVTLRTRDGQLRGCIGHIEPAFDSLADEVASCAVSAALRDSRFAPVDDFELGGLSIEVSILTPPEPVAGPEALDPRRYGVIVGQGERRGVLLPDIVGIERALDQIDIASRKAGIAAGSPVRLERFEVLKVSE